MLLAAAVSLSLVGHLLPQPRGHGGHAAAPARHQLYKLGPWLLAVNPDRFAGTIACQLHTRDVSLQRDTLIFRLTPQGDTTAAAFRVDSGPPHQVAEAFDKVEEDGFFPQRGWVVDPNGGEAALPVSYVSGARAVTIQVSPGKHPRRFEVARLTEIRAAARGLGCAI